MTQLGPNEVTIQPGGMMVGTLGKSELESAAATIVQFHREMGLSEWSPFQLDEFSCVINDSSIVQEWLKNPFFNADYSGLLAGGFVTGWVYGDGSSVGRVTDKFIDAVSRPHVGPRKGVSP